MRSKVILMQLIVVFCWERSATATWRPHDEAVPGQRDDSAAFAGSR